MTKQFPKYILAYSQMNNSSNNLKYVHQDKKSQS